MLFLRFPICRSYFAIPFCLPLSHFASAAVSILFVLSFYIFCYLCLCCSIVSILFVCASLFSMFLCSSFISHMRYGTLDVFLFHSASAILSLLPTKLFLFASE